MKYLSIVDLLFTPFALFVIIVISVLIRNKNIETKPEYKYYLPGLALKLFGGISLCLIYTLYYGGGDTTQYYADGVCMSKLLFSDFNGYLDLMINGMSWEKLFYFDENTGIPVYFQGGSAFMVVRLTHLIVTIAFRSFVVTTLIVAWISFAGVWRMYTVFHSEYPDLSKQMAIAVLFIPSVFFWGSGLLKDTITYSAMGYFIHAFYFILIKRKITIGRLLVLFISLYIIISIKPYLFVAIVPGAALWIFRETANRIRGEVIKFLTVPFIFAIAITLGFGLLTVMADNLAGFSLDNLLERAVISNEDFKRDYYQGNTFDIGEIEANVPSIISKAHLALNATLFRPYIWEARNPVMILSGLENLFFLIFSTYVMIKLRVYKVLKYLPNHGLLLFSLSFSLFLAFAIGITTANFGSLVRYKIPLIPFYVASLYFLIDADKKERESKIVKKSEITNWKPVSS